MPTALLARPGTDEIPAPTLDMSMVNGLSPGTAAARCGKSGPRSAGLELDFQMVVQLVLSMRRSGRKTARALLNPVPYEFTLAWYSNSGAESGGPHLAIFRTSNSMISPATPLAGPCL